MKKRATSDEIHERNMNWLIGTTLHLTEVISGFELLYPEFKESSNRFRKSKFEKIDRKAMQMSLERIISTLDEVVPTLKAISRELMTSRENNVLPSMLYLTAIHGAVSKVGDVGMMVPDVGRIWRWHPDYHAFQHAMEPIHRTESIDQPARIDTLYFYLKGLMKVAI
jgi:hypothetical protein